MVRRGAGVMANSGGGREGGITFSFVIYLFGGDVYGGACGVLT